MDDGTVSLYFFQTQWMRLINQNSVLLLAVVYYCRLLILINFQTNPGEVGLQFISKYCVRDTNLNEYHSSFYTRVRYEIVYWENAAHVSGLLLQQTFIKLYF